MHLCWENQETIDYRHGFPTVLHLSFFSYVLGLILLLLLFSFFNLITNKWNSTHLYLSWFMEIQYSLVSSAPPPTFFFLMKISPYKFTGTFSVARRFFSRVFRPIPISHSFFSFFFFLSFSPWLYICVWKGQVCNITYITLTYVCTAITFFNFLLFFFFTHLTPSPSSQPAPGITLPHMYIS